MDVVADVGVGVDVAARVRGLLAVVSTLGLVA